MRNKRDMSPTILKSSVMYSHGGMVIPALLCNSTGQHKDSQFHGGTYWCLAGNEGMIHNHYQ